MRWRRKTKQLAWACVLGRTPPAAGFSLRCPVDVDDVVPGSAEPPTLLRHVNLMETNRRAGCRTAQFRAGPATQCDVRSASHRHDATGPTALLKESGSTKGWIGAPTHRKRTSAIAPATTTHDDRPTHPPERAPDILDTNLNEIQPAAEKDAGDNRSRSRLDTHNSFRDGAPGMELGVPFL